MRQLYFTGIAFALGAVLTWAAATALEQYQLRPHPVGDTARVAMDTPTDTPISQGSMFVHPVSGSTF
ncbi:hypothetical protein SAMN02745126_02088 [Enhydrobacter aerosaccus]|uniref:Uncharacterized protein n=1 Tax=Enhydrobacter aerosaccus TaxID=225324 RepID=A0A1T4N385_9HYPH|nr:hypothetical protein [Enhydrobacter aerosaccus]SJZ73713.1 hypothetical protein SAMN02745126_02088 [Enhydrobacter aerosaccus]